jgi:quercetin dioxygenase-like cupin family protein
VTDSVTRLTWSDREPPTSESVARRLRSQGVEPYAWSNGPGDRYDTHSHPYEKVLMCAAGSITFFVGADQRAFELEPGDGFVLPAGTEHSAVVGWEGCTCLEGHR